MSDTPETDAEQSGKQAMCGMPAVSVSFARKLERERDEARRYQVVYNKTCTHHTDQERTWLECPVCLKSERDQLRKVADDPQ